MKAIGIVDIHDELNTTRVVVRQCGVWQSWHNLRTFVTLRKYGVERDRAWQLSTVRMK